MESCLVSLYLDYSLLYSCRSQPRSLSHLNPIPSPHSFSTNDLGTTFLICCFELFSGNLVQNNNFRKSATEDTICMSSVRARVGLTGKLFEFNFQETQIPPSSAVRARTHASHSQHTNWRV